MKKEDIIQLWLDAEEENRKHTAEGEAKCLELKTQFSEEFDKLSDQDKQDVKDELESLAA
jgi:hypothetical protein